MDDLGRRAADVLGWGRRLASEVAQLPDTLERLRLGAADFQTVGQRLKASSEALEELTTLYTSTLREGVRRSAKAAEAVESVRSQLERLPQAGGAADVLSAAVSEMQRSFRSWSALGRQADRPADDEDR